MNKGIIAIAAVTIAIAAAFAAIYAGSGDGSVKKSAVSTKISPEASTEVLAATLPDASGHTQAMAQWRGKTLVVNFWAAWCPPCREEMPAFSRAQEKYRHRGVQFVGIALDSADNVKAFARETPVSYPLLVASDDGADLARSAGNTTVALPYTLIIDATGKARYAHLGYLAENDLESLLQQTLDKQP
ncbi:TlpA family protein disulfide reductase [Rhodocyclus tenuis]|uniref:TlpA family protein disulfide reductase n=1 Tax=Rhodocyclus gracilis TaxID=2929842 RepID=A0ABX0WMB2_9RHOO|nr:TlpA disulfide reductase family protein [Rhodocyclus gracilis]NJA89583.1 TlpA family protein disulfide reductase [Rhodocyclus gracilis]